MASVNTITFDQAAYDVGAVVTATVNYTPDSPSVAPQTFTFTANVLDSAGNVLTSSTAPFTVNTTLAGDTVAVSDDGNRAWTEGATAAQPDGSLSAPFTATA